MIVLDEQVLGREIVMDMDLSVEGVPLLERACWRAVHPSLIGDLLANTQPLCHRRWNTNIWRLGDDSIRLRDLIVYDAGS